MTPAPVGGGPEASQVGVSTPEPDSPAPRAAGSWAGGPREGGGRWGTGEQAGRGAPSLAGTYQQALHVDGRARVSDERLQLPLAARARPVPRRGLRGAGHFPRRRGPAHAASPGLAPPAETFRPGGPAARARAAAACRLPPAACMEEPPRPGRRGAARGTRRPRPSAARAPPGPSRARQEPAGGSGEGAPSAAPPRPRGSGR